MNKSASNEIVYIESGFDMFNMYKLIKPAIYKREMKFYRKMKEDCDKNPRSPITAIFNDALQRNVTFIRHYKKLDETFSTPAECYEQTANNLVSERRVKVEQNYNADENSILGTYYRINPSLTTSTLYQRICCFEYGRTIITRYRMGCHRLKIQSGRFGEEQREWSERLCSCGTGVQMVEHALFTCPITANVRQVHNGWRVAQLIF